VKQLPSPKAPPKGVVQTKAVKLQPESFHQTQVKGELGMGSGELSTPYSLLPTPYSLFAQCDTFEDSEAGGAS